MGHSCSRCGGLYDIGSVTCPYCGGIDDSFMAIMRDKPVNVSFTDNGKEYMLKVRVNGIEVKHDENPDLLYADDDRYMTINPFNGLSLIVEMSVIPMDIEGREVLYTARRI